MTAYAQGFMDKCAELEVDPRRLLKIAGPLGEYSFNVGDNKTYGNGLSTRSRDHDYNSDIVQRDYKGREHYPSDRPGAPTIQRLRQADGSVKYRVSRRLPTGNKDFRGRTITENFSVVVDSPYKAMRLAKGNISFDPETKALFDRVQRSAAGRIMSQADYDALLRRTTEAARDMPLFETPKRFGIHVTDPGISKNIEDVQRMAVKEHRINPYKLLKRLAKLHPGKAKLVAGGAMAVPAVGSALYAMLHKRRK